MLLPSATNPSVIFYKNGSVRMMVSRRWDLGDGKATKNNFVMEATSYLGPYHNITKGFDDAIKSGEDPDYFMTKRGYHMLNHNTGKHRLLCKRPQPDLLLTCVTKLSPPCH